MEVIDPAGDSICRSGCLSRSNPSWCEVSSHVYSLSSWHCSYNMKFLNSQLFLRDFFPELSTGVIGSKGESRSPPAPRLHRPTHTFTAPCLHGRGAARVLPQLLRMPPPSLICDICLEGDQRVWIKSDSVIWINSSTLFPSSYPNNTHKVFLNISWYIALIDASFLHFKR